MTPPLRIAVIAPIRYPIAPPHAGGLESSIWHHVAALRARGHHVDLCAVAGSDFLCEGPAAFTLPAIHWDDMTEATDSTYPEGYLDRALPALASALGYIREHRAEYDIVDNHCLHGLPLEWASRIGVPMISTLHTPVLPALLEAHRCGLGPGSEYIAVSSHTAAEWHGEGIDARVVPNAVDPAQWPLGRGSDDWVWFGRVVPEKAPHLAIAAARAAGRRLTIAGRVGDVGYFTTTIAPELDDDVRYAGALGPADLARLVGSAGCALVTPEWEEPFGLVIPEALMTGTPVAAFGAGGIPEVADDMPGTAVVARGDVEGLSAAADRLTAQGTDTAARRSIRNAARDRFSIDARVRVLEPVYRSLSERYVQLELEVAS
jgi:glycosyltransferase involved in cell wall biosynthesis